MTHLVPPSWKVSRCRVIPLESSTANAGNLRRLVFYLVIGGIGIQVMHASSQAAALFQSLQMEGLYAPNKQKDLSEIGEAQNNNTAGSKRLA